MRRARAEDLPSLVDLLGALFALESAFTPDPARQRRGLEQLLGKRDARVLVACHDGAVVGMVSVQRLLSTAQGGPVGLVEDMIVAPGFRRRGVGRRLLEAAESWARSRGLARLQLLTDADNVPARSFYAGTGWRPTGMICLRRDLDPGAAP